MSEVKYRLNTVQSAGIITFAAIIDLIQVGLGALVIGFVLNPITALVGIVVINLWFHINGVELFKFESKATAKKAKSSLLWLAKHAPQLRTLLAFLVGVLEYIPVSAEVLPSFTVGAIITIVLSRVEDRFNLQGGSLGNLANGNVTRVARSKRNSPPTENGRRPNRGRVAQNQEGQENLEQ